MCADITDADKSFVLNNKTFLVCFDEQKKNYKIFLSYCVKYIYIYFLSAKTIL